MFQCSSHSSEPSHNYGRHERLNRIHGDNVGGISSLSTSSSFYVLHHYNSKGESVETEEEPTDDSFCFYECRFPPCTRIEREIREFSICGRCQVRRRDN